MIGRTISHYQILGKLGGGGMGVVYKARDTRLDRVVALKFLAPELTTDETAKRYFIQEARAASALDHPNIGIVHEIDETQEGQSFICMTYYDGETLRSKIDRGPLDVRECIDLAVQMVEGLQRAHEAGIVHRDIKPANVLITSRGVVKIVDFGLAKLTGDQQSTGSGSHPGTVAYMSPEQIRGDPVDHRSDLFSIGIVLYEMLSGKRPFIGEHTAALFYSILNTDPLPLPEARPELPADLNAVVTRLLEKDLSKRYQSAAEVYADLDMVRNNVRLPSGRPKDAGLSGFRRKKMLGILVVGAIIVAAVVLFVRPTETIALKPSEYIVIADFENQTDNAYFDHSLTEAVQVSLRQSSFLNLFPPERLSDVLGRMQVPEKNPLDERTAVEAARREGVRLVLAGSIARLGNGYVLTCRFIDVGSGDAIRVLHREVQGDPSVLSEIDRLCDDIRENLGETLGEISASDAPLEQVTTPSLQALELFSRGNRLERQGGYREAALLKERAVAIDSHFVIAISDLSYIHRKLGNDSLALAYHRMVLPLIGRVTDRERLQILSTYYGPSFEFDFEKSFRSAEELAVLYPNSAEAQGQLGHLAMYFCRPATALEANLRALSLDSAYAGTLYNNSGYAAALDGDVPAALDYFRKSKAVRPTYYAIDGYIAHAHWVAGNFDSTEATLRRIIPAGDPRRRVLTRVQLATYYLARGRLGLAKRECDSSLALFREQNIAVSQAYIHYLLAGIAAGNGDRAGYLSQLGIVERLAQAPYTDLAMAAVSYARNGYAHRAREVSERLLRETSPDPYFVRRRDDFACWIRGELFLAAGRHDSAAVEFGKISKIHCGDPVYFSARRGLAFCSRASGDSLGVAGFAELLDRRGELIMGPILSYPSTGAWTASIIPEASLHLAGMLMELGDKEKAMAHLREALAYWDGADPIFLPAKDAGILLDRIRDSQ